MKGETWKIAVTAFLLIAAIWYLIPTVRFFAMDETARLEMEQADPDGYKQLQRKAIKLGLDLQGGMHVVLQVDKSQLDENAAKDARERALEIIRNRVDEFGVAEPEIYPQGDDKIVADLPALQDVERARALIGRTAKLEFKLVESPENADLLYRKIDQLASKALAADEKPDTTTVPKVEDLFEDSSTPADSAMAAADSAASPDSVKSDIFSDLEEEGTSAVFTQYLEPSSSGESYQVLSEDIEKVKSILDLPEVQAAIPNDDQIAWSTREELISGRPVRRLYLLKSKVQLDGTHLTDARPNYDQYHKPIVDFTLDREGGRIMSRVSGPNIGKPLAIVLDGRVESAPVIRNKLRDKSQITLGGSATFLDAKDLATVLRAGALPAPVRIIENNVVGPTLGEDSILAGQRAMLVALILVLCFMAIYYLLSGLIADLLVFLNVLFLMAVMAGLHATLTLPGIAGIILTLGITVDASVLIFERIRDELRSGKTTKAAIEAGYDRATITIVDSNITTLIAAGVLFYFGTGPIKGFATTLGVGILCSLYTALIVGKTIFSYRRRAAKLSI